MTKLTWDDRLYYKGIDRGVVYSSTGLVEVWNGLMSVTENLSDIRERVRYRDGEKILNNRSEDSFSATVLCFTYPEWLLSLRAPFNMTYRIQKSTGSEIHLVYNALAYLKNVPYTQSDVTPLSFEIATKPSAVSFEHAPSAHLIIDTVSASEDAVAAFESALYGEEFTTARIPLPDEVIDMFDLNALYKVIDNGDGTFTLDAPDEVFEWLEPTLFEADWPRSPEFIAADTYVIRNW